MDKMFLKLLIKIIGMFIVGFSVILMDKLQHWFLIPWVIGWLIYDLSFYCEVRR